MVSSLNNGQREDYSHEFSETVPITYGKLHSIVNIRQK
jgi:hypothetical protein